MLLNIWDAGAWVTAAQFAGLIIAAYIGILWVTLAAWTWRDVRSRTADTATQAVSVVMVAAFFLPGLLLYMAMRPQETAAESYSRKIEEEAFLREIQRQPACPSCRRAVEVDYNNCPHCLAVLRVACDACGERLAMNWIACAYCGEARPPVAVAPPEFRRRLLEPVASPSLHRNGHQDLRKTPVAGTSQ